MITPGEAPLQAHDEETAFWLPTPLLCTWVQWPLPTTPFACWLLLFTLVQLLLELLEPLLLLLLLLLPRFKKLFLIAAITEGFFDLESEVERGLPGAVATRRNDPNHLGRGILGSRANKGKEYKQKRGVAMI